MNVSWLIHTSIYSWTNTEASIGKKDVSQQSQNPQMYYLDKEEIFLVLHSRLPGMDDRQETRDEEFL